LPSVLNFTDGTTRLGVQLTRDEVANTLKAYKVFAARVANDVTVVNHWLPRIQASYNLWRDDDPPTMTFSEVLARGAGTPQRVIHATKAPDGSLTATVSDSA
jgi:hypothetical protein